jgi:hypothetical protein
MCFRVSRQHALVPARSPSCTAGRRGSKHSQPRSRSGRRRSRACAVQRLPQKHVAGWGGGDPREALSSESRHPSALATGRTAILHIVRAACLRVTLGKRADARDQARNGGHSECARRHCCRVEKVGAEGRRQGRGRRSGMKGPAARRRFVLWADARNAEKGGVREKVCVEKGRVGIDRRRVPLRACRPPRGCARSPSLNLRSRKSHETRAETHTLLATSSPCCLTADTLNVNPLPTFPRGFDSHGLNGDRGCAQEVRAPPQALHLLRPVPQQCYQPVHPHCGEPSARPGEGAGAGDGALAVRNEATAG